MQTEDSLQARCSELETHPEMSCSLFLNVDFLPDCVCFCQSPLPSGSCFFVVCPEYTVTVFGKSILIETYSINKRKARRKMKWKGEKEKRKGKGEKIESIPSQ